LVDLPLHESAWDASRRLVVSLPSTRLATVDTSLPGDKTRALAERKTSTYEGKVIVTVEGKPPEQTSKGWSWSGFFKHPLTIAFLAAAFTALFLPLFTRQWQDRQKERELKKSLLEKMSTASTTAVRQGISLVNGQLIAAGGEKEEDAQNVYAALRNSWLIQRAGVRSAIITYFPQVNSCWYSYERALADYLGLVVKNPASRKARIEQIKQYVNSDLRDFYGRPGSVDQACVFLKEMPPAVVARYQELKGKIPWAALTFETTHPRYRDAYQSLGEELLIADDRIIQTIVSADARDFDHGVLQKDWIPFV
jgi:hypothetical protein